MLAAAEMSLLVFFDGIGQNTRKRNTKISKKIILSINILHFFLAYIKKKL